MIDAPIRDDLPQITMFDALLGVVGEDNVPDGACRRCKQTNGATREHVIGYPGAWHQFSCCDPCIAEITNAMDKAVKEARVHG